MSITMVEFKGVSYVHEQGKGFLVALFEGKKRSVRGSSMQMTAIPVEVIPDLLEPKDKRSSTLLTYYRSRGIVSENLSEAWEFGAQAALQASLGDGHLITDKTFTDVVRYMGRIQEGARASGVNTQFRSVLIGAHRT